MGDATAYTGLITSQHADKPNFMAMVAAVCGAVVDQQNFLNAMPEAFDLDNAVGPQLDAVGAWVGISRNVNVPIDNVYFSWDETGVGWDQGVWMGPSDPSTGVTVLDDGTYLQVIQAKIGANNWDGTLGSVVPLYNAIFGTSGTYVKITDNSNLTFTLHVLGPQPSALFQALLTGGYIPLKPTGVAITYSFGS
ncbi:DUF2612 domain-containing protein [Dyella mobilis]|uniref:DUF2612 domain-containing protein n=1 Tax=Dyella mobilis TaxID=1849582 RepID=A0ABS2KK55_9GAMM|nr:DUF2612 domain-containing protein [Dyella mobilis]MBM7131542.1 DUF2612 domain-containing protein [Dyella mobilis]GLQ96487.1 hypothetical protein GCM10007863_09050 [Dyella mobilis]